jgi:hypothetical protein
MKATILTSAIALLALSATAAPQQAATAEQAAANVPQQTLSSPAPVQSGDSPLVAAAKRTGRLNKKPTAVITNETLLKSGGHFTTTKEQGTVDPKAAPAPIAVPANTSAAAAPPTKRPAGAAAKKDDKNEANKEKALKRAVADYMGESIEEVNDDPSAQEGGVSQGIAPKPAAAPKPAEAPKKAQPPL